MDLRRYPRLMKSLCEETLRCEDDHRISAGSGRKAHTKAAKAEREDLRARLTRLMVESVSPESEREPVVYGQAEIDADVERIKAKAEAMGARDEERERESRASRWYGGGFSYDPDRVMP